MIHIEKGLGQLPFPRITKVCPLYVRRMKMMKLIMMHINHWLIASAIVLCIAAMTAPIIDMYSLNGSGVQRVAAAFHLLIFSPCWFLCLAFPKADGPVYLVWAVIFWGIVAGEIGCFVRVRRYKLKNNKQSCEQGQSG
jgi:hypothetical protein